MKERNRSEKDNRSKEVLKKIMDTARKTGMEKHVVGPKTKTSFSIDGRAQILIRRLAEETGIKQGEIIDYSPLLFKLLADKSLERRKNALKMLRTLQQQIESSFAAMKLIAPHLSVHIEDLMPDLQALINDEEDSVEAKNYGGLETCYWRWEELEKKRDVPAYFTDLKNLLADSEEATTYAKFFFWVWPDEDTEE